MTDKLSKSERTFVEACVKAKRRGLNDSVTSDEIIARVDVLQVATTRSIACARNALDKVEASASGRALYVPFATPEDQIRLQRLRALVEELGGTKQAAAMTGVSQRRIRQVLASSSGARPLGELHKKLAQACKRDPKVIDEPVVGPPRSMKALQIEILILEREIRLHEIAKYAGVDAKRRLLAALREPSYLEACRRLDGAPPD